jgi:hypothetical protein
VAEKLEPLLNQLERQSAVWVKIERHLAARLEILRAKNDKDLDDRKTSALRGRIAEVKHLTALGNPAPTMETDDS